MQPIAMLLALLSTTAFAQGPAPSERPLIRVHLMEAKTDKPIKNVMVAIAQLPTNTPFAPFYNVERPVDSDGVAEFRLPSPLPPAITAVSNADAQGCSSPVYCTADILSHGVVGPNLCWPAWHKDKPQPQFHPKPGDLYIFEHKLGYWDYFLQETFNIGPRPAFPRQSDPPCATPAAAPPKLPSTGRQDTSREQMKPIAMLLAILSTAAFAHGQAPGERPLIRVHRR